jgi:uncharacterized protein (TIGR03085 family)
MSHHAADERHALAETLRRVAPDAPTLSGEWTAAQLAAHLVLRERSIAELAGRVPIAALQRRAARLVDDLAAARDYRELVDAVDSGPAWTDVMGPVPIAWLWALPPVRERANMLEYLVHHEDVRRAVPGWEPRALPDDTLRAIWTQLHLLARLTMRAVPVGVTLDWPGHGQIRSRLVRRGAPLVTVSGDPVELGLFAFGRGDVARVEFDGPEADVQAVRRADISL